MRLLLDTCVWGGVRKVLYAAGHDVIAAADWDQDPGDAEVLNFAIHERRTLVTLDKDFGELVVVHGIKHTGILRLVNISGPQQALMCSQVIEMHEKELAQGALITAEYGRLRIRPPES